MKINVVCVGNIKDKFYNEACAEYLKRLKRFADVSMIETTEAQTGKNPSDKTINDILKKEAEEYSKYLKGFVIVLDSKGENMTSEAFSDYISGLKGKGFSEISFLIGSSHGICKEIKEGANCVLSFSKMTFPHRLFRVMLLEQIYRACMIESNMSYHK